MKLRVHRQADVDYEEAYEWYSRERHELAEVYSSAVAEAVERMLETPERWPEIREGIRRCKTDTFPYGRVYQVRDDEVFLISIMHLSRQPEFWQDRL